MRAHRILWGEGMFLRPQHFQQQALAADKAATDVLWQVQHAPWGVRNIDIDMDALRAGQLCIAQLQLVLRDGAMIDAPHAHPLPAARNLDDIAALETDALVYACLPAWNPSGGNSADSAAVPPRPPRFLYRHIAAVDLFTEAAEAEITSLQPNLRLLLEVENRDAHDCVPIARIMKDATGAWTLDEAYIPPLVTIASSRPLEVMVKRLLDIMLVKCEALMALHSERSKATMEFGTSDISSFWLLHTLNRNFPLIRHWLQTAPHPEQLYLTLAQLCGELVTFSPGVTLRDIPAYDHRQLTQVFGKLNDILRQLLDTVISSRHAVIPLTNPRPGSFVGHLPAENFIDNADFYLSVASDIPVAQLLELVPLRIKIGSPDDVERILNSALPGVRLHHLAQTPSALPVRVANHYFALERQGQIFERMLKSGSICLYVPQALADVRLELIAVFRQP